MINGKSKFKSLRGFACAVAASLCMMVSSPSSHATAFQVAFDPYTELFGVAIFDVSAPCLANDGTFALGSGLLQLVLNGCTISLVGAHISTDGANGTFVDYVAELPFVIFYGLMVGNNELAGLATLPIRLEEVGVPDAFYLTSLANFGSYFVHEDCDATLSFTLDGGAVFRGCDGNTQLPRLTGEITSITRVPEPATLALVFGAGFAGWLTRRRKRAA